MSDKETTQVQRPACPVCETAENVIMAPEAGYWYCNECGERGAGTEEPIWWRNDPESMWYVEEQDQ
jgi:ribosomal protein L37AE/L43A